MNELEGRRKWEKYPRKYRRVGWSGIGTFWEEKTNMSAREWWGWRCRGKEGEEDQSGGGWIASGTSCRRNNYQGRTHKTGLDGGVSQDTSTPHESGKRWRRRRQQLMWQTNEKPNSCTLRDGLAESTGGSRSQSNITTRHHVGRIQWCPNTPDVMTDVRLVVFETTPWSRYGVGIAWEVNVSIVSTIPCCPRGWIRLVELEIVNVNCKHINITVLIYAPICNTSVCVFLLMHLFFSW